MTEPTVTPLAEPLSAIEARILGCLVEKQTTTPESYPLTLNSLLLACNQKTSREPLMNLNQGEVARSLRPLEERGLLRLVMGSRADRWEQRLDKALELTPGQTTLLALLLLRGPQTLNELLVRSARMHAFDDVAQIQHNLERLISRGMACLLPRQSGQREDRYMHSLGSEADLQAATERAASSRSSTPADSDKDERIASLESRLEELEQRLALLERKAD
jgi:uncharacterized protein YceH (UPF0502 family)